jgi:hypothetical protein
MSRRTLGHTEWCAHDQRCGLNEHRSEEIIVDLPGAGRAILTRVQGSDGSGHAEIRMSVNLPDYEPHARARLVALLSHLEVLIGPPRESANRPQGTRRRLAA